MMETDDYYGLENLLEVVVEEQDQEVNVPNNNEPDKFELPPVPTFDLQSPLSSFAYMPSPIVVKKPIQLPVVPPPKPKPSPPAPKAAKPIVNLKEVKQQLLSSFESTRMVLDRADKYPKDLTIQSADEMSFYHTVFKDLINVTVCRLHCTICDKHIGCGLAGFPKARAHRMLKVLICKDCFDFYGDGKFPLDQSDNTEVYCRWCGQGGDLVCCSFCPKVFCNKCVKRNFDTLFLKQIEKADEWACFCCAQIPLWPLRAVCRALLSYLQCGAKDDITNCCKKATQSTAAAIKHKRPIVPKAPVANQVANPMVVFNPSMVFPSGPSVKPAPLYKLQYKPPIAAPKPTPPTPPTPRPQYQPSLPSPSPSAVQKPIETPKSRAGRPIRQAVMNSSPKPAAPSTTKPSQAPGAKPNLPANMPKVRIDHSTMDTTVVRLRLSNNKEQYLRVNVVGSCQRMPRFPPNPSITMTTLAHAFRANKLAYDRLKGLKVKLEEKKMGNISEEATAIMSMLNKWKEAIQVIEDDLAENLKLEEKKSQKKSDDVIELSDDEDEETRPTWKFLSWNNFVGDSDVEIIDEPLPSELTSEKRKQPDETENPLKKIRLSNGVAQGTAHENSTAPSQSDSVHSDNDGQSRSGVKLVDDDAETETDEEVEEEQKTDSRSESNRGLNDSESNNELEKSVTEISSDEIANENSGDRSGLIESEADEKKADNSSVVSHESLGNNDSEAPEGSEACQLENGEAEDSVNSADVSNVSKMEDETAEIDEGEALIGTAPENSKACQPENGEGEESVNSADVSNKSKMEDETAEIDKGEALIDKNKESETKDVRSPDDTQKLASEVMDCSNETVDTEAADRADAGVSPKMMKQVSREDDDMLEQDNPPTDSSSLREEPELQSEGNEESAAVSSNETLVDGSDGNLDSSDKIVTALQLLEKCVETAVSTCTEPMKSDVVLQGVQKSPDVEPLSAIPEKNIQDENNEVAECVCPDDEKMQVDEDLEASLSAEDTSKDVLEEDIDEEALLNDG